MPRTSRLPRRRNSPECTLRIEHLFYALAIIGTLSLAGFYYTTNYSISDLKLRTETDSKARQSLREALSKNAEDTEHAIAELSKHAAVQDERTLQINNQLQTIQGQLSTIATSVSPAGKREK